MALAQFVSRLLESGHVCVSSQANFAAHEFDFAARILREFEFSWRQEVPAQSPEFDEQAAVWGAARIYQFARLLTFREYGLDAIAHELKYSLELPPDTADVHYSVDLTARFLPDLVRLVRVSSDADPLLKAILQWGSLWPLSSVGIQGIEPQRLANILATPSLLTMYVDRILRWGDSSRLKNKVVQSAVSAAIGTHEILAGKLSDCFSGESTPRS